MTNEKTRKGYLLAYALTKGIIECDLVDDPDDSMVRRARDVYFNNYSRSLARWTREDAESALRDIVAAKRKSIEKQLAKLDKLAASPRFTTEAKVWPERKS